MAMRMLESWKDMDIRRASLPQIEVFQKIIYHDNHHFSRVCLSECSKPIIIDCTYTQRSPEFQRHVRSLQHITDARPALPLSARSLPLPRSRSHSFFDLPTQVSSSLLPVPNLILYFAAHSTPTPTPTPTQTPENISHRNERSQQILKHYLILTYCADDEVRKPREHRGL
jgi:hypothetical protein